MDSHVADEVGVPWESENIPDEHLLYMRVHRNWFDSDGTLKPGAFRNTPTPKDGMSTDWSYYSSPEETRRRTQRRPPEEYSVIQMMVGKVRNVPDQTVKHTPQADNRAHTDVFGEKNEETRSHFMEIYEIVPL